MVIFAHLFISISISFQTLNFKQYFQNLEQIKKCCQNEQLKFINTIYNQLNVWKNMQLVKQATTNGYSFRCEHYIFSANLNRAQAVMNFID